MTSWVILIASKYPQHWKIAKNHSFWDMTRRRDVALGDTVYFWQAGGSIVSQCTATSSAYPMTDQDAEPWEDSGEREYVARFHFDCLSESPLAQPRWGELQARWPKPYPLQLRSFSDPADEAVLAQYFDSVPVSRPFGDVERENELKAGVRPEDVRSAGDRSASGAAGIPTVVAECLRAAMRGHWYVD